MLKLKILIIDDEVDYCTLMKSYFEDKGYEVSLAYTLKDGLHCIETIKPNILFLDNNLPDGKAWPHVEKIVEKFPTMKLYLLSAYHQRTDYKSSSPNVIVWEKPLSLKVLNQNF
jgi:DNA-binding response OmpR family regulator